MRNRPQPAQQILQLFIVQQQRVAAAQQHVADFRMLGDVVDLPVEIGMKIVAAGVAHQPRAGAIAAITRATVGDQKQHAVGIAMHQARHRRMRVFAARVAHFPGGGERFLQARHHLAANRAILVRRINQIEKIGRDAQRQLVVGQLRAGQFLGRQRGQQRLQLFHRGDPVFHLPAPVVPVGLPEPRAKTPARRKKRISRIDARWPEGGSSPPADKLSACII